MTFVWADALGPLLHREDLDPEVLTQAMETILAGNATDAQISALAVLLRAKGETPEEIAALVGTMLRFTTPVDLDPEGADGVMVKRGAFQNDARCGQPGGHLGAHPGLPQLGLGAQEVTRAVFTGGLVVAHPGQQGVDRVVAPAALVQVVDGRPAGLLEAVNPLGRLMAVIGQAPAMQLVLARKSRDGQLITTPLFETMTKVLINAPKASEFVF